MATPAQVRMREGPKGADGLTAWQRERIATDVKQFHERLKPVKPMVSIRNLSPAFLRMAIELDVCLCEYRDKQGAAGVIHWGIHRNGIPSTIIDASGNEIANPDIERIHEVVEQCWNTTQKAIGKISAAVAVTGGDKTLKTRADNLGLCPWLRQLDWLQSAWWEDERDGWEALARKLKPVPTV